MKPGVKDGGEPRPLVDLERARPRRRRDRRAAAADRAAGLWGARGGRAGIAWPARGRAAWARQPEEGERPAGRRARTREWNVSPARRRTDASVWERPSGPWMEPMASPHPSSARLGSARLGSARLGSAPIMARASSRFVNPQLQDSSPAAPPAPALSAGPSVVSVISPPNLPAETPQHAHAADTATPAPGLRNRRGPSPTDERAQHSGVQTIPSWPATPGWSSNTGMIPQASILFVSSVFICVLLSVVPAVFFLDTATPTGEVSACASTLARSLCSSPCVCIGDCPRRLRGERCQQFVVLLDVPKDGGSFQKKAGIPDRGMKERTNIRQR